MPLGTSLEKKSLAIGSVEIYELLYDFNQQLPASTYPANGGGYSGTQTRYNTTPGATGF